MRQTRITKIHELAIRSGISSVNHSWSSKLSIPEARDKHGNSLLMLAAKYGKDNLVQYFLKSGVSPYARNNDGLSAADLALHNGFPNIYEQLSQQENTADTKNKKNCTDTEEKSSEFGDNDKLNGWESEADSAPPKHDEDLAAKASKVIHQFHGHKPVDHSKEWREIKIELPSQKRTSEPNECDFPLVQELIAFSITNHIPVSEEDFFSAVENEQISMGIALPDFFWESLPERLGFKLEPTYRASIEPTKEFLKKDYSQTNPEINFVVNEALKQWRAIDELWVKRYTNQFQLREVIDRQKEERLGQRMDSSVLAIRSIAQKTEYREVLETLKAKYSPNKIGELTTHTEEDNLRDESLIGEDSGSKTSAFIDFITRESSFMEGDLPPRPSSEDMVFITEALTELNQKFLGEIEDQYRRYLSARNQFFLSNLRLVVSIAKKYKRSCNSSLEDHVQNGLLGLLKAIEKYNYRLGFKFSTYSTWWIRQHITRELANQSSTIRLPVHIHESRRKFERAIAEQNSSLADEQAVRDSTGFSSSEIEKIKDTFHHSISIDILNQITPEHLNYSETNSIESPFKILHDYELKNLVKRVIGLLEPKQTKILQMRFGLDGYEEHTLEEVGQVFGVTRERIRQIESQALRKLKGPSMFQHFESESSKGVFKHDTN